jgi:hypothetical protein
MTEKNLFITFLSVHQKWLESGHYLKDSRRVVGLAG